MGPLRDSLQEALQEADGLVGVAFGVLPCLGRVVARTLEDDVVERVDDKYFIKKKEDEGYNEEEDEDEVTLPPVFEGLTVEPVTVDARPPLY